MKKNMTVLVLAQYFPPDVGGASTRASNVVKGLLNSGCKVKVIAAFPHYPDGNVDKQFRFKPIISQTFFDADVYRVSIFSLPHNSVSNRILLHTWFIISSLFALPFVGHFDVIWAANPNLFCFFPALVYSMFNRKPMIRNVDDLWPEVFYDLGLVTSRFAKSILDGIARLSYILPCAITPISKSYKNKIIEKYGINERKLSVVEVGVESVVSLVPNENSNQVFRVMYSGVLGIGYDFDTVLKAASFLSQNENIIFFIRGRGELETYIKRKITQLNLKNVFLDARFVSKKELSEILLSVDAFLLPMSSSSLVDQGLPTKIFEYQSYGKPIVCCSEGESAKYIKETNSGLVINLKSPAELANAILKLYHNRELSSKLGKNGLIFVSKNLTLTSIGQRMYSIFSSVLYD